MAKIKLEYDIDLWIVGQADRHLRVHAPGSLLPGPLFSIGQVTLRVGLTKKEEFTLGQDGRLSLSGFGYHNTKKGFLKGLKNSRLGLSDYMEVYKWLSLVKQKDRCTFTDAFINSIFRDTFSNRLWINRYWDIYHKFTFLKKYDIITNIG